MYRCLKSFARKMVWVVLCTSFTQPCKGHLQDRKIFSCFCSRYWTFWRSAGYGATHAIIYSSSLVSDVNNGQFCILHWASFVHFLSFVFITAFVIFKNPATYVVEAGLCLSLGLINQQLNLRSELLFVQICKCHIQTPRNSMGHKVRASCWPWAQGKASCLNKCKAISRPVKNTLCYFSRVSYHTAHSRAHLLKITL